MADREWFVEDLQVYEDGTEEYFVEGIQFNEDQAAVGGLEIEVAMHHYTKNIGSG